MCHKYLFCLLIWLTGMVLLLPTAAQQPATRALPQITFHFHKITQAEGLSSYNVKRVMRDRFGYTWIATQDGLNRFDGRNITIYNKGLEPTRRLVNNDVWDLAEDTVHHRLWVLTYGGLDCINLANGQVIPSLPIATALARHFPAGWFTCLRLAGNRLWVGTHDSLAAYDLELQAFIPCETLPLTQADRTASNVIERIWSDEFNHVWVLVANYGIVIYSAGGHILQRYTLAQLGLTGTQDFDRFRGIAPLGRGRLAVMTNTGLFDLRYDSTRLNMTPFVLPARAGALARAVSYFCTTDPQGRLWFGANDGLYSFDPVRGQLTQIRDADFVSPENWFSDIYWASFDSYDHLWLGTQKGVAFTATSASPFTSYFQSADFSTTINHANYPCAIGDSLLYICAEDGFYKVNPVTYNIRRLAEGRFFYATKLKDGRLLISGYEHLYVLRGQQLQSIEKVYPELVPVRDKAIVSLAWCGDSLAILGCRDSHGIYCWNPRRKSLIHLDQQSHPLALASDIVNSLYHDRRGRIWVLSDAVCSIYDPARQTMDTLRLDDPVGQGQARFYFDMTEAQGLYWLAIYGSGLLGLDSNLHVRRFLSSQQGLANTGVYKVFSWGDSLLFVTSNNGICRIRIADTTVVNYFQKDGLHDNGFEESCGSFDGHYIYAGGERGISRIDPNLIVAEPVPAVLRIGNVRLQTPDKVDELGDLSDTTLTVPSEVVRATLTLFTFNYTDEGRILLSYRIPELNTQWIPVGTDRTIDLLGLRPGHYTLLVRTANASHPADERHISLLIYWQPKWYQTLWFQLAVIAACCLLFYAFYRYRIHQIRQQQLIRQNLSSDLHDDIGSILNSIRIFTHLARKGPEAEAWLSRIEGSLAQAVVAVRDMIWVLDDSQDTVFELLERIRHFAIPLADANDINLEVTADGPASQTLTKDEKRNLLLVAKEAVNNSIKYARCSHLSVRLGGTGHSLTLRIEDDGVGFDVHKTSDGNGLRNIARRARRMRYSAKFESTPGNGTRIILAKL